MARWIWLALPLAFMFSSVPATAEPVVESVTVEGVFSSGGPRQLLEGESESITADLGMAFSRIDFARIEFTFEGDLLAEGEELHVGIDSFCCYLIRHFFSTPRSDRSISLSSGNSNAQHFLDGFVEIDATMNTGSIFLQRVVVSVTGVPKRPSRLIPIEPGNFAPDATVVDFENLAGTGLPFVPNLRFDRTIGGTRPWFGATVSEEGSLFGEAYLINQATSTRYSELAIEFETPVEAVGAWIKQAPNFRNESPQRLTIVAVDPYLNTIQRRVLLPGIDEEPRFIGFSSEDGIIRLEWLGGDRGWFGVDDITFGAFAPLPRPIEIDIRPGSDVGPIHPSSRGNLPVAILGSETFDVFDVDVTTLAFGPGAAARSHDLTKSGVFEDHLRDVNDDGLMDLLTHYRIENTGIEADDMEACLTGETLDGTPFEGCDAIRAVADR